jgi:hypothetical protein
MYPHKNRVREFADAFQRTGAFELISASSKINSFSDLTSRYLTNCTVYDVVRSATEILYSCEGSGERYFLPVETASSSLSLKFHD